jgi:hypothetical protein
MSHVHAIQTPFSGGCQCGAVRYECSAEPGQIQMFKCHCRDCQQVSGGPFAAVVYVPAATFRLTRGTIAHHATPGGFGPHQRGFCAQCGSRLTGGEGPGSTGIGMTAASLDDPSWFKPQMEMWVRDAQPWDQLDPELPQFDTYPPQP